MVNSISSFGITSSYTPPKSKPILPSFASIRVLNFPPTRRSFSERGECQSGDALFHLVICSGADQYCQTFCTGARTVASIVILVLFAASIFVFFYCYVDCTNLVRSINNNDV